MTDNYGEHQCDECGAPLSRPGLCARCKALRALDSCSTPEQPLTPIHGIVPLMTEQYRKLLQELKPGQFEELMQENDNEDS